eukprot:tig00000796_g4226.t1
MLAVLLVGAPAAAGAGSGSGRPWIRVATGGSLRLRLVTGLNEGSRAALSADPERSEWNLWPAALSLVAACAAASGGLGSADVECGCSLSSGPGACIGDLLSALVPPGAAACPALRSVQLRSDRRAACAGLPPDLERLLYPFPNLEGLSLPQCCAANRRDDVAAIVHRLPRLKRLEIAFRDYRVGAGLGALSSLESLAFVWVKPLAAAADGAGGPALAPAYVPLHSPERNAAPLLEGLASGPAALSLKEIRCDEFLSGAAVRALARLAALQSIQGRTKPGRDVGEGDAAALASLPALRALGPLALLSEDALPRQLRGLAAALERSGSLETLEVHPRFTPVPRPAETDALAALARASRGRLSLEISLVLHAGYPGALAAALAGSPLRRLVLRVTSDEYELLSGQLAGPLATFAACSARDFEVRMHLSLAPGPRENHDEEEAAAQRRINAAKAAAVRALGLPAARVIVVRDQE